MAKLPPISQQHRICVIREGLEDLSYFNRLLDLKVWSSAYKFTTINAKSASNIPARFEDAYHNNQYEKKRIIKGRTCAMINHCQCVPLFKKSFADPAEKAWLLYEKFHHV